MNPAIINAVAGVSTFLGLLATFAYFFLHRQAGPAERSIREVAEGEGLFNAEQIVKIIADFKDEAKKLEALSRLADLDHGKAKALLTKVENKVSVTRLAHLSSRRYLKAAKVSAILLVLLAVLGFGYAALTPKTETKQTGSPDKEIVLSSMSLERATDWKHEGKIVRLNGAIRTNGYPLSLSADKVICENASIKGSFDKSAESQSNTGSLGQNGENGRRDGAPGENGGGGGNGLLGAAGSPAGTIVIQANEFSGDLYVEAQGQHGGNGGTGGAGGQGGNGHQGSPSRSGIVDCSAGPGFGGKGGNGGRGGSGGNGGNGGTGAEVVFSIETSFAGRISIDSKGGGGGTGGSGGQPGRPGAGGPEGTTTGWCRPSGRNGAVGNLGAPGASGLSGQPGASGRIKAKLPHQEEKHVDGRFEFKK